MRGFLVGAIVALAVSQAIAMIRTAELVAQVDAMEYSVHYELAKLKLSIDGRH